MNFSPTSNPPRLKYLIRQFSLFLLVALVYFLLGRIGHYTAAFSGYASPVWPASGWALATAILFGRISIPGIFLGSFLYNISIKWDLIEFSPFSPYIQVATIIGLGSSLQALLGSIFYPKLVPNLDPSEKTSYVVRFLWLETIICTTSPSVANCGLYGLGVIPFEMVGSTWTFWWLGDVLGVILYFPFFLSWMKPDLSKSYDHHWKESLPVILLLLLFSGVIFNIFRWNSVRVEYPITYLLMTLVIWASLRFNIRESSLALMLIASIAIVDAIQGSSQFRAPSKELSLLLLQSFLSAISITSLLVLSVVRERKGAEERLKASHKELEEMVAERTTELTLSNNSLGTSEARYRGLFENVPTAIFECNYTKVKKLLDRVPDMGKKEFYKYLRENPDFINECYRAIQVVDANRESLRLFRAPSKEVVLKLSRELFSLGNMDDFKEVLYAVRFGATILEKDATITALDGSRPEVTIRWCLPPEFSETFSSVIISAVEITEKKNTERQLKASLKEKEVMLKEIHHRVKNNLQVISSLFSLQSEYVNDPDIHDAFVESQSRIQTMALIHDELYQSKDLGQIEFLGYANRLIEKIKTAYSIGEEIFISLEGDKVEMEVNQAIPLGLALNELLSNCFKYAFPPNFKPVREHSRITVGIHETGNSILVEVADNGIGLSNDLDPLETPSFGLTLVQVLTKQLKGRLDFSSMEGRGTSFKIRFPKVPP
ncbi:histidine kinase [Leptospira perolatii]|uniref:histidine kinase n=1 Tax=Leptospira perolatii TaxID=2023191 RepID=A0A2M9ZRD8_9LEPT|nr:MASE1 domain-containing protein [Leptospira perolatii]PJZ70997.1 histidine kinase [Leptospira perolatii]PJZ74529.1 histidine kinase [Leptospira perolatii]